MDNEKIVQNSGVLNINQKEKFIPEDANGKHPEWVNAPSISNLKKFVD